MKIIFDDGSFLTIDQNQLNENLLEVSMCAIEGKKTIILTLNLNVDQVDKITEFFSAWKKKTQTD